MIKQQTASIRSPQAAPFLPHTVTRRETDPAGVNCRASTSQDTRQAARARAPQPLSSGQLLVAQAASSTEVRRTHELT